LTVRSSDESAQDRTINFYRNKKFRFPGPMETLDEEEAFFEQQNLIGFGFQAIDEDILRRASHRLSAMLPK